MKKKKEKPKQTSDNFDVKNFIIKTLRGAFRKAPMYREAKARAKEDFFVEAKNGNGMRRVHFKCASCGKFFLDKKGAKEIAVDHIDPVIDLAVGWVDYDTFIKRLFCGIDNLQVLCNYKGERGGVKSCHKIKTAKEKGMSAINKKQNRSENVKNL